MMPPETKANTAAAQSSMNQPLLDEGNAPQLQKRLSPSHELLMASEQLMIKQMFEKLDLDRDGSLSEHEIRENLKKLRLPYTDRHVRDVMTTVDTDNSRSISYDEFRVYVINKYKQLVQLFAEFDANQDGIIDVSEVQTMLKKMGMDADEHQVKKLITMIDKDQSGGIDFEEWSELLMMIPISNAHSLLDYWKEAAVFDLEDGIPPPPAESHGKRALIHLSAGAIAGALSRTGTAPLERLKILYQINTGKPPSLKEGLRTMYRDGGIRGLWRGNGVNCLKIAPESAVKFLTFEAVKRAFADTDGDLSSVQLFISGAAAGVAAHTCFFPLEVIKTRVSASHTGVGIAEIVSQIRKNEGKFLPFYRGLSVSLASTIPHSGFNLMAYESCKRLFVGKDTVGEPSVISLMAAGATSSTLSQFVFYPLHTIKARIIIKNHSDMEPTRNYNGIWDVIRKTLKREGARGFYKGFLPSFLKSVPAHGILYSSFEVMKRTMGIEKKHKHH